MGFAVVEYDAEIDEYWRTKAKVRLSHLKGSVKGEIDW